MPARARMPVQWTRRRGGLSSRPGAALMARTLLWILGGVLGLVGVVLARLTNLMEKAH